MGRRAHPDQPPLRAAQLWRTSSDLVLEVKVFAAAKRLGISAAIDQLVMAGLAASSVPSGQSGEVGEMLVEVRELVRAIGQTTQASFDLQRFALEHTVGMKPEELEAEAQSTAREAWRVIEEEAATEAHRHRELAAALS